MNSEHEENVRMGAPDPNLLEAVGGYHKRRRPGWYVALILLGFGLGAVLALAVSSIHQSADIQDVTAERIEETDTIRAGLIFSDSEQVPDHSPDVFTAGIGAVYVHLWLEDRDTPRQFTGLVKLDGTPFTSIAGVDFIEKGNDDLYAGYAIIQSPDTNGFQKGIYEVTVKSSECVAYEASFVVVDSINDITTKSVLMDVGVQITEASMCTGTTQLGEPQERRAKFSIGDKRICLAFKFANAQPGIAVKVEWLYSDELIPSGSSEIVLEASEGWAYAWIQPEPETPLLPGNYSAIVRAIPDGEILADERFTVVDK